jgi:hypothetical protein
VTELDLVLRALQVLDTCMRVIGRIRGRRRRSTDAE